MVKAIIIHVEDEVHEKLTKIKGKDSWRDYLLNTIPGDK